MQQSCGGKAIASNHEFIRRKICGCNFLPAEEMCPLNAINVADEWHGHYFERVMISRSCVGSLSSDNISPTLQTSAQAAQLATPPFTLPAALPLSVE
jgi:hypothetical protein